MKKQATLFGRSLTPISSYLYVFAFILFLLTCPLYYSLTARIQGGPDATVTRAVNRATSYISVRATDDIRLRLYFLAGGVACFVAAILLSPRVEKR